MRCPLALALLLSSACASTQRTQSPAEPTDLAFTRVNIIDVESGRVLPEQTVLIAGNRIQSVGPSAMVPVPSRAQVVDARGKYLIPGMIDTHVHLFMPWNRNWPDTIAQFGWIMASGVTTIRDAGGRDRSYVALRTAADSGRILAPRMRISGWAPRVNAQTGASGLPDAISTFPAQGLDGVKLRGTPREHALEIIQAARREGLPVYGHTDWSPTDSTQENYGLAAVQAGISGLMHLHSAYEPDGVQKTNTGPRVTYQSSPAEFVQADLHALSGWLRADPAWQQMLIDTMVARGVWLEPTLTVTFQSHPALYGYCTREYDQAAIQRYFTFPRRPVQKAALTPAQADTVQGICRAAKEFVRRFYEAGGMIIAGADADPFPPLGVTEEMRLLVEAGLPSLAALQAATINAARALEMEEQIGTIEPGKFADLVLLEANPLDDITNVRKVSAVVADGRLLDREALLARTGTTPAMVAYDALPEKIDERVQEIARQRPDSIIDVVIHTNDLMRPEDLPGIEQFVGMMIIAVDGDRIRARGSAARTGYLSRIRFVRRIDLADASADRR